MSSIYVLDSSFRRTQIKVTPGKYLREILDEACASRKINPEEYGLKSSAGKTLDLSQPFRLSGLTAGAKLNLVQASRSPSVVTVALQLPESEGNGRLSDKFASNTSLWLVLRKFEEGVAGESTKKLNITQQGVPSSSAGAGRLMYREPCLNVTGRLLESFEDLQKTLAQLGFNGGNVMMRLSFRDTERPLEEAMAEISQYFEKSSLDDKTAQKPSVANTAVTEPTMKAAEPAETVNTQPIAGNDEDGDVPMKDVPQESATTSTTQPSNGISVYLPPTSTTPAAALHEEDPAVFEPSVDDARSHQASLLKAGRNTRLLSDKELEEQENERQAKLATVRRVDVRIRFPDQSMIEIGVEASESAAGLYTKVRECLRYPNEPFELRFVGSKGHQTLPDDANKKLVKDFAFRGKVLTTCVWKQEASARARSEQPLKDELQAKAQELKVDLSSQQLSGPSDGPKIVAPSHEEKSSSQGGKSKGDLEAKMKKFLGFGKK